MASRRLSTSREKNKQMVKFKWCNQNLQVPILKSFKCKINLHKWQLDIGRADTRHGQSEANQVANLNQLKNQFNSSKLINKQKQFSRTLFYKIIINSGEKKNESVQIVPQFSGGEKYRSCSVTRIKVHTICINAVRELSDGRRAWRGTCCENVTQHSTRTSHNHLFSFDKSWHTLAKITITYKK